MNNDEWFILWKRGIIFWGLWENISQSANTLEKPQNVKGWDCASDTQLPELQEHGEAPAPRWHTAARALGTRWGACFQVFYSVGFCFRNLLCSLTLCDEQQAAKTGPQRLCNEWGKGTANAEWSKLLGNFWWRKKRENTSPDSPVRG